MARNMLGVMKMIKNMDLGLFIGQMEEYIVACGRMGGNMEKENIWLQVEKNAKAFGKMGKECNGFDFLLILYF